MAYNFPVIIYIFLRVCAKNSQPHICEKLSRSNFLALAFQLQLSSSSFLALASQLYLWLLLHIFRSFSSCYKINRPKEKTRGKLEKNMRLTTQYFSFHHLHFHNLNINYIIQMKMNFKGFLHNPTNRFKENSFRRRIPNHLHTYSVQMFSLFSLRI